MVQIKQAVLSLIRNMGVSSGCNAASVASLSLLRCTDDGWHITASVTNPEMLRGSQNLRARRYAFARKTCSMSKETCWIGLMEHSVSSSFSNI